MVISFNDAVHRLCELTNDRKTLEKAIGNAKVGEFVGTTLNDAVVEVARKEFRTVTGRKAIILLSDGQDFGSIVPTDELLDEQSESDTMVYSIYYAPEFRRNRDRPSRRGGQGRFPGRAEAFFGAEEDSITLLPKDRVNAARGELDIRMALSFCGNSRRLPRGVFIRVK